MSSSWMNRDWYFKTITQTTQDITTYFCNPQSPDSDSFLINHMIPDLEHLLKLSKELEAGYSNDPIGSRIEIIFFVDFNDTLYSHCDFIKRLAQVPGSNHQQQLILLLNERVRRCKEFLLDQSNKFQGLGRSQLVTDDLKLNN